MNVDFKPRLPPNYVFYVKHTLHVKDGWVVVYDVHPPFSSKVEQRTAYVLSDGSIKWDLINQGIK